MPKHTDAKYSLPLCPNRLRIEARKQIMIFIEKSSDKENSQMWEQI